MPIFFHSQDLIDTELDDLEMELWTGGTWDSNGHKLHQASYRGDLEEIKKILAAEKNLNPLQKAGDYGQNALHSAAQGGQLDVMKYFVEEKGCNPASQDDSGWTPLHYAARLNDLALVQYLVDGLQVDPMCQTNSGYTPLHTSCMGGNINVLKYIVNAMSKYLPLEDVIMCKNADGDTAVHVAATYGHMEIIKFFNTKFNSDTHITDGGGRIADPGSLVAQFLTEHSNSNVANTGEDTESITGPSWLLRDTHLDFNV